MVDRRTFLKSGAVATAGLGTTSAAIAAPATQASSSIVVKTVLSPRFSHGYLRDRADRFALRIKQLTGGRLSLDLNSAQSPDIAIRHVRNGRADAYFGTEADHSGEHPALAYFGGLPRGYSLSAELFATWLAAGGGQLHWDGIASDLGIKAFAVGHSGDNPGMWANRDIDTLSQLSGLQADISGVSAYVAERLGLVVGSGAAQDMIEPLMGPAAWLSDNQAGSHRIWFRDGFNGHGAILSFGLSRNVWDSMGEADQAILTTCANEAYHQSIEEHKAHDMSVAPALLKAHKVDKRTLPDDIQKAVVHVTSGLLDEWRSGDIATAHIHESYMHFLRNSEGSTAPLSSGARVA